MKNYYGVELQILIDTGIIDVEKIIGDETRRAGNSLIARRVNNHVFPKGAYVKMLYTDENDDTMPTISDFIPKSIEELILIQKFQEKVSPKKLHIETIEGKFGQLTLLCFDHYDGTLDDLNYTYRRLEDLSLDLASKLDMVHNEGFMHRDVKPENVLYKKKRIEGKRKKLYGYEFSLTDFGITKNHKNILDDASQKTFAGTWIFISPEYMKCNVDNELDLEKSEIFSYGMTLAVFAIRGNTFDYWNTLPSGVYKQQKFYEKDKHRKLFQRSMRRMSKQSKGLIMACTDPNPRNRPASFEQIVTTLR